MSRYTLGMRDKCIHAITCLNIVGIVACYFMKTFTGQCKPRQIDGWLGWAMVLGSFQSRGVLLLLHIVGQGPDGPDIKLFILVGLGRSFFVCCLAHRGSTVGFILLQCSSGVVRHPRDLQVSVATHFCRVLIFASS